MDTAECVFQAILPDLFPVCCWIHFFCHRWRWQVPPGTGTRCLLFLSCSPQVFLGSDFAMFLTAYGVWVGCPFPFIFIPPGFVWA